jgi:hypothetical protein
VGGSGSGSHYHWWRSEKKTTVEECLSIDANRWTREGILRAGVRVSGSWAWTYRSGRGFAVNYDVDAPDLARPSVRLWYSWIWRSSRQEESADYSVRLGVTQPHFGGLRWWFLCPLTLNGRPCGRRVGKLYLPPHARYFGCRHCHQLTYSSCQESHKYDGLYRLMARDLGWDVATVKWAMDSIGNRRL